MKKFTDYIMEAEYAFKMWQRVRDWRGRSGEIVGRVPGGGRPGDQSYYIVFDGNKDEEGPFSEEDLEAE